MARANSTRARKTGTGKKKKVANRAKVRRAKKTPVKTKVSPKKKAARKTKVARTSKAPSGRRTKTALALDPDQVLALITSVAPLEGREKRTAECLLWGLTDAEIGDVLGCAERTAKRSVAAVLATLGVSNRSSLLRSVFLRQGLKPPRAARRSS